MSVLTQNYSDNDDTLTTNLFDLRGDRLLLTNPEGYKTSFKTDVFHRCTVQKQSRMSKNSGDVITEYDFDTEGNETSKSRSDAAGTVSLSTHRAYDHPLNVLTSRTDAMGMQTVFVLDCCGNIVSEGSPNGPSAGSFFDTIDRSQYIASPTSNRDI